jgi:hypothetical protein
MPELAALEPDCPPLRRPEKLFDPSSGVHGLRAAQTRTEGDERFLDVWLFADPPSQLADPEIWRLTAPGAAAVGVEAASVEAAPSPHLELKLAGLPEPGSHRLEVTAPASVRFDPLRTWLPVRLRPECEDGGECAEEAPSAPAPPAPSPVHDYMARDWRSLRRALVEYLLREEPDADTSIADPTIALIELFAHAGDLLHYRLDRVATEAYLGNARLRASVRRHARLLDYRVGEGAAAETCVHIGLRPRAEPVEVRGGDVAVDEVGSARAFTLESDLKARAALGEIAIYDWGEEGCCLRAGATECVLVRPVPADALGDDWLRAGDLLAFEVVDPDDRDRHLKWARRELEWPSDGARERFREPLSSRAAEVVELVAAEPFEDPLLGSGLELTLVRWDAAEALTRSYPVGVDTGAGGEEVTVARGNLVRAHHGRLFDAPARRLDDPPGQTTAAGEKEGELLLTAATVGGISRRPDGTPRRLEVDLVLPSGISLEAKPIAALLDASPGQPSFVVEPDELGAPVLRFRTGAVGDPPPAGSSVRAAYEVGGGLTGNVPANALRELEHNLAEPGQTPRWQPLDGVIARNPVPASGGADPAPLDSVRRDAPEAFAAEPRRAVLPADLAAAAAAEPIVQRATASREWSGSWPLVATVVDLRAEESDSEQARASLQARLDGLRMLGTEVAAVSGTPVGLLLALEICARPGYEAGAVRAGVLAALRPGSEERPGLFHPSRLLLGQAVYLSAVLAAVAAVPGVDAVEAAEARRLSDPAGTVREVFEVAADEVIVLDDDPARPGRGRIEVRIGGGR